MRVTRDEHVEFLTELREGAAKALDAQPDDPFRLEVFALIDRDLQNALRAQQEREEGHPKPRKPASGPRHECRPLKVKRNSTQTRLEFKPQ